MESYTSLPTTDGEENKQMLGEEWGISSGRKGTSLMQTGQNIDTSASALLNGNVVQTMGLSMEERVAKLSRYKEEKVLYKEPLSSTIVTLTRNEDDDEVSQRRHCEPSRTSSKK